MPTIDWQTAVATLVVLAAAGMAAWRVSNWFRGIGAERGCGSCPSNTSTTPGAPKVTPLVQIDLQSKSKKVGH